MKHIRLDIRRNLFLPGDAEATLKYAVDHWVETANNAIKDHGFFAVALSGGSTPKKIFQVLSKDYKEALDWTKVYLFWSDERAVPPSNPDSNFHMAMIEGGLTALPIPETQVFRMQAEKEIEANAHVYEQVIEKTLKGRPFDLIMLGMGDDGHTASLFPKTKGLQDEKNLVVANYVPQKNTWRMSFTYKLINQADQICLYVIGENKAEILQKVLFTPLDFTTYPSQNIGTETHHASWIIDDAASQNILVELKD